MDDFDLQKEKELILTNEITPFDSYEEIKEKLKQKYFERKKQEFDKKVCEECLSGKLNKYCPYYGKCPYVKSETANTIINKFKDFTEIIFYKSNFHVPNGVSINRNIDRSRKWLKDEESGLLIPRDDGVLLENLQKTINDSRKRALDNLFGYILCNDWNYFVTITFKHGKTKKLSDDVVKYQWQKFRQQLQYRFPDIKIILVPEDTPTGVKGMHFHGFIGNADLSDYIRPARNNAKFYKGQPNPKYGEFEYTEYGDPVFNFLPSFVNIGFTTIVKIKDNSNKLKLVNYIIKYMNKDSSNFDYNENTYLRTYNLDFKNKEISNFTNSEKEKLINDIFVQKYKETDSFVIYRKFNEY